MKQYDFTVCVVEEIKTIVTVEADNKDDAVKKVELGEFLIEERQEAMGVRSYEILSFDSESS